MDLLRSVTPSASQVAAPAVARARARSGVAASLAQKATTPPKKKGPKKAAAGHAGKNEIHEGSSPFVSCCRPGFPEIFSLFRTDSVTASHMESREDDVDEIEEISGALSATRGQLDK